MSDESIPSSVQAAIDDHLALPGVPDANHPEPDADGHVWEHVEISCPSCGTPIRIHRQKPEWLAAPAGVKIECPKCESAFKLGGFSPLPPADYVLECVQCHATHDPNLIEQSEDGSWTCPACDTEQRHVALGEHGAGSQTGATA